MEDRYRQPQQNDTTQEHQRPVAYDADGKPLYAAPVNQQQPPVQHQVVHVSRSVSPIEQEISPEVKARHDESKDIFPHLNLSDQEYVISAVHRHPIGMWMPVVVTVGMISLVLGMIISYPMIMVEMGVIEPPAYAPIILIGSLLALLFAIGGYAAVWVYQNNGFYLTNESVIQEIQSSIFSRREQTVSLMNIEDASFSQKGIVQSIFNYGSIRLSTEGEETTYRFDYVANPKKQIAILNNAVEAFKNGRPVES